MIAARESLIAGCVARGRSWPGRKGLVAGPVRETGGSFAGTGSEGQDHNACGIHTLHFPHYAATLPPPWWQLSSYSSKHG
jgi:hypothetical protein